MKIKEFEFMKKPVKIFFECDKNLSQHKIQKATGISLAYVANTIKDFERGQLIKKIPINKKEYKVALTKKGKKIMKSLRALVSMCSNKTNGGI